MFVLVAGMVAIGAAVGVAVFLLGARAGRLVPAGAGDADVSETVDRPGAGDTLHTMVSRISDGVMKAFALLGRRVSRATYPTRAQHLLDLAGNPPGWTIPRLLGMRGLGLAVGVMLGLFIGAKHGLFATVGFAALLGAFLMMLPDLLLRRTGEHRQEQLRRGLPDAIDMLTVCVEAGMGFDAAVARVGRTLTGPIADEFSRVLQEMQLGRTRTSALRALVERTDVPELRAFVATLVQATELGVSIGDVLREQSHQMRVNRRQRAEERAQKMQVKLLLPLIMCLLPAMFVVVLGPAVIHLADFFAATK